MNPDSRIYVAGHTGMVGSALTRRLSELGYSCIRGKTRTELDLTSQQAVADYFATEKPEYVFVAAARVGGILANTTYPAWFIYENLMIGANIIHQAYLHGVKKLLFLGSSCIYPANAPQPLKEEYLLTGELEKTNEPYAIAKIAGIKLCESYYRQYGCNFLSVMPTNLYGPNDNFDLETSHVLPAMIRKMHLARCLENGDLRAIRKDLDRRPIRGVNGSADEAEIMNVLEYCGITLTPSKEHLPSVIRHPSSVTLTLWGTGKVFREFLHVDDMADACIRIMETSDVDRLYEESNNTVSFINIGCGEDQTIAEIAGAVQQAVGFGGEIRWDPSKPDGTYRKKLDVTRLNALGWRPSRTLAEGIASVYDHYTRE